VKIKEAADKLNISPRAIRFYEQRGLLSPSKQPGNRYRVFTENEIWRLQTIVSLREAGMSLSDIRQALEKWEEKGMEELQYYLELQRSVMTSEWLRIRQAIETADHMIEWLRAEKSLPLEHIFRLAKASRQQREQRSVWKDRWDFNRLAPTHDERVAENSGNYADYEAALERVVQWVNPSGGELGLDIGTGTGNLAGRFIEKGCSMSGVDQSREMLRLARTKYPGLAARLGNFLALPYLRERFDFVVSSFAFHHLTEDQQWLALEEMQRLLSPGGRICIADLMDPSADGKPREHPEYPSVQMLAHWFETSGYAVKTHRVNHLLHIIHANKEER